MGRTQRMVLRTQRHRIFLSRYRPRERHDHDDTDTILLFPTSGAAATNPGDDGAGNEEAAAAPPPPPPPAGDSDSDGYDGPTPPSSPSLSTPSSSPHSSSSSSSPSSEDEETTPSPTNLASPSDRRPVIPWAGLSLPWHPTTYAGLLDHSYLPATTISAETPFHVTNCTCTLGIHQRATDPATRACRFVPYGVMDVVGGAGVGYDVVTEEEAFSAWRRAGFGKWPASGGGGSGMPPLPYNAHWRDVPLAVLREERRWVDYGRSWGLL